MCITYLLVSYLLILASIVMPAQQSNIPPLVFSPTANPTYHYSPQQINEFNPTVNCTATSLSYALVTTIWNYIVPWADTIKSSLTRSNYEILKSTINAFLWKYKYIIAGNILFGSYVTTSMLLLFDYQFINDAQRWSQWKHEQSFEELCTTTQQQLTKELLLSINQRNYNNNKPTDINHPLITFISDINNEIYRINRYIYLALLQKQLHLIKIFPTSEKKIKRAEQLLTRAHFIKHLFLSWLAEYNIHSGVSASCASVF